MRMPPETSIGFTTSMIARLCLDLTICLPVDVVRKVPSGRHSHVGAQPQEGIDYDNVETLTGISWDRSSVRLEGENPVAIRA